MKNSLLLIFFLFTSCNYSLGRSSNNQVINISVPYIEDDYNGQFTNELIKQISYSPKIKYNYIGSDFDLKIKIISKNTSQIGYKYDRDDQNKRRDNLRATEGRLAITASVEVVNNKTNKVKLGPLEVSYDAEFDYVDQDSVSDLFFLNSNDQKESVLNFSLGQLESIDNAKDASLKPLYEGLSKKIVDAISTYW